MARLPVPGGDAGSWGAILNEFLETDHNSDGSLKTGVVTTAKLADSAVTDAKVATGIAQSKVSNLTTDLAAKYVKPGSGIPETDLATAVQTKLNTAGTVADGSITTAKLADSAVTIAKIDKYNQAGGVAALDGAGDIITAAGVKAVTISTVDAVTAGKINDPVSATATALNAQFVRSVNGILPDVGGNVDLDAGSLPPVTSLFTSTANELVVDFDATASSGSPTLYTWDFNDGQTGTGVTIQHTFASAGTYRVRLTVTGSSGQTDLSEQFIAVTSATAPVGPTGPLTQDQMPTEAESWTLATAPVITTSATSTHTGSLKTATDPIFSFSGTQSAVTAATAGFVRGEYAADKVGAGTGTDPLILPSYGVRFKTNAATMEFRMQQRPDLAGKEAFAGLRVPIRVKVNGKWISTMPYYLGLTNAGYDLVTNPEGFSAGTQIWVTLDFGSSAERVIEFESSLEFGGVKVPDAATFTKPAALNYTAVLYGDSMFAGELHQYGKFSHGQFHKTTYPGSHSMGVYGLHTVGYDNIVNLSSGSSGYNIVGEGIKFTDVNKIADVAKYDPDIIIVGTGFNDFAAGQTAAAVKTNANTTFAALRAQHPNAIIFAFGLPVIPSVPDPSLLTPYNNAIGEAAVPNDVWFLDPPAGELQDPDGLVVNVGTALFDPVYINTNDNTHPTQEGARVYGLVLANVLRKVHAAIGTGGGGTPVNTYRNAPTRVQSYGPNGTHWPDNVPFVYSNIPHQTTVACTWTAIKDAVNAFTDTQINAGAVVWVEPGTLPGFGSGNSSKVAVENFGRVLSKRVLIAPRDGFGSVNFSADGVLIHRADGVCFTLFTSTGGVTLRGCQQSGMAWCRVGSWRLYGIGGTKVVDGVTVKNGFHTRGNFMYEVVRDAVTVGNGDPAAILGAYSLPGYTGEGNGWISDVKIVGAYHAVEWLPALDAPEGSYGHNDGIQVEGDGQAYAIKLQDSVFWGSNNSAIRMGGVPDRNMVYVQSMFDQGLDPAYYVDIDYVFAADAEFTARTRHPLPPSGVRTDLTGSAFNATGWTPYNFIKDSIMIGSMYKSEWQQVDATRSTLKVLRPYTSGTGWIYDAFAHQGWTNVDVDARVPVITTLYLQTIWAR